MDPKLLSSDAYAQALALRDLTDTAAGPHALQLLVAEIVCSLRQAWGCDIVVHRGSPVVSVEDNYSRLGYPPDAAARDAHYTRYVTEPHQLDLWRISNTTLGEADLRGMVDVVLSAALPAHRYRARSTSHPYTVDGLEVEVDDGGRWVEVAECGLASPDVLAGAGLASKYSGLAMGIGLDRLLMLRKGIDDIRLLRSDDERVASQMLDLRHYKPVSSQPPAIRDISIAVGDDVDAEELGDRVRTALGGAADAIEAITILAETPGDALPPQAAQRLGLKPGQRNMLVRLVLRHATQTLTDAGANEIRDLVYGAVHQGSAHQWASSRRT